MIQFSYQNLDDLEVPLFHPISGNLQIVQRFRKQSSQRVTICQNASSNIWTQGKDSIVQHPINISCSSSRWCSHVVGKETHGQLWSFQLVHVQVQNEAHGFDPRPWPNDWHCERAKVMKAHMDSVPGFRRPFRLGEGHQFGELSWLTSQGELKTLIDGYLQQIYHELSFYIMIQFIGFTHQQNVPAGGTFRSLKSLRRFTLARAAVEPLPKAF